MLCLFVVCVCNLDFLFVCVCNFCSILCAVICIVMLFGGLSLQERSNNCACLCKLDPSQFIYLFRKFL